MGIFTDKPTNGMLPLMMGIGILQNNQARPYTQGPPTLGAGLAQGASLYLQQMAAQQKAEREKQKLNAPQVIVDPRDGTPKLFYPHGAPEGKEQGQSVFSSSATPYMGNLTRVPGFVDANNEPVWADKFKPGYYTRTGEPASGVRQAPTEAMRTQEFYANNPDAMAQRLSLERQLGAARREPAKPQIITTHVVKGTNEPVAVIPGREGYFTPGGTPIPNVQVRRRGASIGERQENVFIDLAQKDAAEEPLTSEDLMRLDGAITAYTAPRQTVNSQGQVVTITPKLPEYVKKLRDKISQAGQPEGVSVRRIGAATTDQPDVSPQIDQALNLVDETLPMVDLTTVGPGGMVNRYWEVAKDLVNEYRGGTEPVDISANELAQNLVTLQSVSWRDLVGPGQLSEADYRRLNEIFKGRGFFDSPAVTRNALQEVRSILQRTKQKALTANRRAKYPESKRVGDREYGVVEEYADGRVLLMDYETGEQRIAKPKQ